MLTCGTIIVIGWQMGMGGVPSGTPQSAASKPTVTSKPLKTSPPPVIPSKTPVPAATQGTVPTVTPSSVPVATQAAKKDGTIDGDTVSTRYGDVQVSVTFSGNTITDVTALHLTDADNKSVSISNRAEPTLKASVLQSQSANVDSVSGATYTSEGYLQSVQSAIDKHNA